MSVKRLWFPNDPDGKLGIDDRYQLTVGWPLELEVTTADELTERYMRRYLNDPTWEPEVGPPMILANVPETEQSKYMRRYLNDPIEQTTVGPVVELNIAPETTLTRYLRRYLVDPKK